MIVRATYFFWIYCFTIISDTAMDSINSVAWGKGQRVTGIGYSVPRVSYRRALLFAIRDSCTIKSLRAPYLPALAANGLLKYRGARGGRNKQRCIKVLTAAAQPRPTKCLSAWSLPPQSPRELSTLPYIQLPRKPSNQSSSPSLVSSVIVPPTIYALNINSKSKPHAIEQLEAELKGYDVDIAVISETHLKAKHNDCTIGINRYTFVRRDRLKRRRGGIREIGLYNLHTGHVRR